MLEERVNLRVLGIINIRVNMEVFQICSIYHVQHKIKKGKYTLDSSKYMLSKFTNATRNVILHLLVQNMHQYHKNISVTRMPSNIDNNQTFLILNDKSELLVKFML